MSECEFEKEVTANEQLGLGQVRQLRTYRRVGDFRSSRRHPGARTEARSA